MSAFSKMFCAMLFTLSASSAYAEPESFLALDNGYRWDKISNRVSLGGPTVTVRNTTQTLRKLNSYQLGGRGQWSFCNGGFIRANGHYGWVFGAEYDEGPFDGDVKGHTYDIEASFGKYYCLNSCIGFAPVIGWSYDAFIVKGEDISVAIEGEVFDLSNIKANQRFSGPFIGFDFVFQPNSNYTILFGYEFHYAHWHGDRIIEGEEYGNPPYGTTTGYSNTRHLDGVLGNVFKLDTSYTFCNCITVGLELKLRFFRGDFGRYKQTEVPIIPEFTYRNVDDLAWTSFATTAYIGTTF